MSDKLWDTDKDFNNWLAGFTAGEGCFQATVRIANKPGTPWHGNRFLALWFTISLRSDDEPVLWQIYKKLGVGKVQKYYGKGKRNPQSRYSILNVRDLYETLIPIFDVSPLRNKKQNEYEIWRRIVERSYKTKKAPWYTRNSTGSLSGRLPYSEDYWVEMNHDVNALRKVREFNG